MTGTETPPQGETNRDRVRRLLIEPLDFRHRRGAEPDRIRDHEAKLCDELAYLNDDQLVRLRIALATKGEGSARCFWPSMATVRAFADVLAPRPIEEHPALLSWFRSEAGPRAAENGQLVATWAYIFRWKVPPSEGTRAVPTLPDGPEWVARKTEEYQSRLRRIAERRAKGWAVTDDDAAFALWHREKEAYLDELVQLERAAQKDAADAV